MTYPNGFPNSLFRLTPCHCWLYRGFTTQEKLQNEESDILDNCIPSNNQEAYHKWEEKCTNAPLKSWPTEKSVIVMCTPFYRKNQLNILYIFTLTLLKYNLLSYIPLCVHLLGHFYGSRNINEREYPKNRKRVQGTTSHMIRFRKGIA